MPQVIRADIETKLTELVGLIMLFHGWDSDFDKTLIQGKKVQLNDEIELSVVFTPTDAIININAKPGDKKLKRITY